MTASLGANADNDIYLGPDGNLVVLTGLAAVQQNCEAVMEAQLGEMVLAQQQGIPTDATIWSAWNPVQFEAFARTNLLTVPDVIAVTAFSVSREGEIATYSATIQTTFGRTTVNGIIQ